MTKPRKAKMLDVVVLERDIPEHGLLRGDIGTIVFMSKNAFEVEFVTTGGYTQALLTLHKADFRPMTADEIRSVRPSKFSGQPSTRI